VLFVMCDVVSIMLLWLRVILVNCYVIVVYVGDSGVYVVGVVDIGVCIAAV